MTNKNRSRILHGQIENHIRNNIAERFDVNDPNDLDVLNHSFWVNDLLFIVPPNQISIDTDYNIFQWKGLRTETTNKVHSGDSSTYIKVTAILPSGNSILNVNYSNPDKTGRRGGLLDLILEFKYTPFCYIENAFLRSSLQIKNDYSIGATIHQLNVSTMQGFPNSLQVEMLFGLFNYRPYSIDFSYKDRWDVKPIHGGYTFDAVNLGDIEESKRNAFEISIASNSYQSEYGSLPNEIIAESLSNLWFNDPNRLRDIVLGNSENDVNNEIITRSYPNNNHLPYEDTLLYEDLQDNDNRLFIEPVPVHGPASSNVYTSYVDWLRRSWNSFGYDRFQPIGAIDHDVDNKVTFKWREYSKFSMPNEVFDSIKENLLDELGRRRLETTIDDTPGRLNNRTVRNSRIQNGTNDRDFGRTRSGGGPWSLRANPPRHIIVHSTAGSLYPSANPTDSERESAIERGLRSWVSTGHRKGLSTHFLILADGTIINLLPWDTHVGYHAGGWNSSSVGIDLVGSPPHNSLQISALGRLIQTEELKNLVVLGHVHVGRGGENTRVTSDPSSERRPEEFPWTEEPFVSRTISDASTRRSGRDGFIRTNNPEVEAVYNRLLDSNNGSGESLSNISINLTERYISEFTNIQEDTSTAEELIASHRESHHDDIFTTDEDILSSPFSNEIIEAQVEEENSIYDPEFSETINNSVLPDDIEDSPATDETVSALRMKSDEFNQWVRSYEEAGWVHYTGDVSILDVFYMPKSLTIRAGNGSIENNLLNPNVPVCNSISTSLVNIFKELPLNGHQVPTAQYLGGMDTDYNLSIICNGLADVQKIQYIKHILEYQAINFKFIPDSWSLEIENKLMNAFGHKHVILTREGIDTVPGNPGMYHVELQLKGHKPFNKSSGFIFMGAEVPSRVVRAFFRDIVENGWLTRSTNPNSLNTLTNLTTLDFVFPFGRTYPQDLRDSVLRVGRVIDNINLTLLKDIDGLDINNIDFLDLGPSVHGENSLVYRAANQYNEDIVLGLLPNTPWDARFGDHISGNGFGFAAELISHLQVPPIMRENQYGGMQAPNIGEDLVISPNVFGDDRFYLSKWLEEPYLWNIGWKPYEAMASINYRLQGHFGSIHSKSNPDYARYINENLGRARRTRLFRSGNRELDNQHLELFDRFWYVSTLYSSRRFLRLWEIAENGNSLVTQDEINTINQIELQDEAINLFRGEGRDRFNRTLYIANPEPDYEYEGSLEPEIFNSSRAYESRSGDAVITRRHFRQQSQIWVPIEEIQAISSDELSELVSTLETYLYNNVFIPSLYAALHDPDNAVGLMERLRDWSVLRDFNQGLLFPNMSAEFRRQSLNSGKSCYPDLLLPSHPYWDRRLIGQDIDYDNSVSTQPDFYFYNWGFEGGYEDIEDPFGHSRIFLEDVNGNNTSSPLNLWGQPETAPRIVSRISNDNTELPDEGTMPISWYSNPIGSSITRMPIFGIGGASQNSFDIASISRRIQDSISNGVSYSGESGFSRNSNATGGILSNSDIFPRENTSASTSDSLVNRNLLARESRGIESNFDWRSVSTIFGRNSRAATTPTPNFALSNSDPNERNSYIPVNGSSGGWESTLWPSFGNTDGAFSDFEDNLDYSFTRDGLYYLAYEGMKDLDRKKFAMRRAFPTFKVMFVENDTLENNWVALDDFYSYNQVQSIRIVDSRKVPASLAVIEFINVSGMLTGNDKNAKAARIYGLDRQDNEGRLSFGETQNPEYDGTSGEQSLVGFELKEGTRIIIKLGYNTDSNKLEEVFKGQVVEVQYNQNSDSISVTAQSYATELVAKIKGRDAESRAKPYRNTFELLAHMMYEPEVLDFGRITINRRHWAAIEDQSIETNELMINAESGPGISWGKVFLWTGRAGLALGTLGLSELGGIRTIGGVYNAIDRAFTNASIIPQDGPQDDNIFVPDESALVDHSWLFDDGEISSEDYEYHLYNTVIWDVFQEMTLRHPGWVAAARPYGNSDRMTMFFGLPSQRYWFKDINAFGTYNYDNLVREAFDGETGGIRNQQSYNAYLNLVGRRYRPFRGYHILTSQTDIIMNNIKATTHGFYNTVSMHYWDNSDVIFDENGTVMTENNEDNVVTVKACSDLKDSDIREQFVSTINCKGETMARRYALSSLTKFAKEMYKGSIIVLGNSRIKPYDLCYISDTYNDICGPVEVEEVVHTFSHETGFITEIVPDAFVIANDIGTWWTYFGQKYFASKKIARYIGSGQQILPEPNAVSSAARERVEDRLHLERDELLDPANPFNQGRQDNPFSFSGVLGGGALAISGIAGIAGRSPVAVGATALSTGLWMLGDYLYYSWLKDKHAFFICPLIRQGSPWVVGMPWTSNTGFIKLVGDKVRRWWSDSEDGIAEWHYTAARYRHAVWDRFDGDPGLLTRLVTRFNSMTRNFGD